MPMVSEDTIGFRPVGFFRYYRNLVVNSRDFGHLGVLGRYQRETRCLREQFS